MILITGAGGKTGRTLVKTLSKVESVCAFVHREEHVSMMKSLGADKVIVGDIHNESVIRSAMQGARSVYHICPNMNPDETVIGKLVIGEACKTGVEHFVYHSVLHPQTEKMKHHWQKLRVEEMLFESGLPFTILQPAPYMQNLLASWGSITEDGVLRVPYSVNSKFSFVDLEDLAETAKIVLTEPNHLNAIYELAGTLPISHVDVAKILSRILNSPVRAEKEEIENWRLRAERSERFLRAQSKRAPEMSERFLRAQSKRAPEMSEHFLRAQSKRAPEMSEHFLRAQSKRAPEMGGYTIENLIKMFEYYDQWGLMGNPNVSRWLLKREPTSFEIFIGRIVQERDATH
ncbi:MAG: NmrA family NAD(P)-binding protein [Chloroflexi bacterium]|nr:NmrA family NAD(P)-binding protein [Chloroflexota bacterium]